jgi:hypothetical protein
VKLGFKQGKTIVVRVLAPEGATAIGVNANHVEGWAHLSGQPAGDGRVELRGLPDGDWKIHVWAKVGEESWQGEATAPAGATVEVSVKRVETGPTPPVPPKPRGR